MLSFSVFLESINHSFPKGTYYIGDLAIPFDSDNWSALHDEIEVITDAKIYEFKGFKFWATYMPEMAEVTTADGLSFPIDTASIGVISLDALKELMPDFNELEVKDYLFEFDKDFNVSLSKTELKVGDMVISVDKRGF